MLITGSDDKTIIVWNTVEWYSAFMHDKIRTIRPHKYLRKHDECKLSLLSSLFLLQSFFLNIYDLFVYYSHTSALCVA